MAADGSPGADLAGMVAETRGESPGTSVPTSTTVSSPRSESPPTRPDPSGPEAVPENGSGAVGNAGARRFLCGVVEGFYGRPWIMEQRKELFRRLQKWGLNTYLYAPKDDYKHRMFWREMYSVEEAEQLMTLIAAAQEYEIEFIYAISPGLDITFSNPKEVSTLKRKLDQVSQFGCKCFALLFDDIDHNMCAADKEVFSSFAHAQVSITNEIYQYLGEPETFLFCPTGKLLSQILNHRKGNSLLGGAASRAPPALLPVCTIPC